MMPQVSPPEKDPSFLDDLAFRTRTKQSPVPPPPRQLVRKAIPDFLNTGLKRSAILHVAVVLCVLVQPFIQNLFESEADRLARLRALQAKTAIRVDMVDLPKLKVDDLNKVDPTEKAGQSAPPPPPPAPEPVKKAKKEEPTPEPPPSKTAMRDKTRPEKETKAAPKKKETAADRLKALRDSLRADNRRKELAQKLKAPKKEGNRPELAGNIVSEGDSTSGDLATIIDAYNGKVKAHLKRNYNVPGWMTTGKLNARVLVKIAPDGRVLSQEFLKRSGNAEFDGYVQRAIEQSDPFPAPPEHWKRMYMEDGLEWGFPQ